VSSKRVFSNYKGHLGVMAGSHTVTHFKKDGTVKNRALEVIDLPSMDHWQTFYTSKLSKEDLTELRDFLTSTIEGME